MLGKSERNGITFPNPGSSALEQLTDGDSQEIGARVEFAPTPFGARRALAGIQNRELALAKAHRELQEKEMALVGELSFTEMLYFLSCGRKPDAGQVKVLDACLVTIMEHGINPSTIVARSWNWWCPPGTW